VTWGKPFWDTRYVDFMTSAVAIGPAMREAARKPVGETILRAVRDTRQFVSTNTNLGMLLLLAPLAKAAASTLSTFPKAVQRSRWTKYSCNHSSVSQQSRFCSFREGSQGGRGLRAAVEEVLQALTVDDARHAFEAIRLAAPGGLGDADVHDVHAAEVSVTLLEAMRAARERDAVAREYVTDFAITFELGYPALRQFLEEGQRLSSAIVQTALTILALVPDTLILRKEGPAVARDISRRAAAVLEAGGVFSERGRAALAAFDRSLRGDAHRLNPGTTADLTTASIFVYLVEGGGLERFPDLLQRW
jgi:triphosphoribosyl-dephospho-CoA synthase